VLAAPRTLLRCRDRRETAAGHGPRAAPDHGLAPHPRAKIVTAFCAAVPRERRLTAEEGAQLAEPLAGSPHAAAAVEAIYCAMGTPGDQELFAARVEGGGSPEPGGARGARGADVLDEIARHVSKL
jgi:hypothetical protein